MPVARMHDFNLNLQTVSGRASVQSPSKDLWRILSDTLGKSEIGLTHHKDDLLKGSPKGLERLVDTCRQ